jgi:hypothetical protein
MKQFFPTILLVAFYSCNNSNGKIEERDNRCFDELKDSKKIFLVNKSRDKTYQFTYKMTQTVNDTVRNYETYIITLALGDERYLGCSEMLDKQYYQKKKVIVIIDKEQANRNKELLNYLRKIGATNEDGTTIDSMRNYSDTVIKGVKTKYYVLEELDSTKPIKRNYSKFTFEITGEVESKDLIE